MLRPTSIFPRGLFPRPLRFGSALLCVLAFAGCDDESGKKRAQGEDAGVGDGAANGGSAGVAGNASTGGSGGMAATGGAAGSGGGAGIGGTGPGGGAGVGGSATGGSAGSAGVGGSAVGGSAGSAGTAGTGGTGGSPGSLVIDTWGDPQHTPATYIAVSDAAGWTTYSPVAPGNLISHPLSGSGAYLALVGCGDAGAQERRVFVVAGSFAELPLVRIACGKYAAQSNTVALGGSGTNLGNPTFSVTAGRTTAFGNAANSQTYSMQLPPATYDLILAERIATGGAATAEVLRNQAILSNDTARVHDFASVPAVSNRSFTVNGSTSDLGSVYLWTAGGSFLDTNFSFSFPMDFWEPAALAAGDAVLAISEEFVAGGGVRLLDVSGGGNISMTPPALMGPSALTHSGSIAANTRMTWTSLSDASVYCGNVEDSSLQNFWLFSVTPSQAGGGMSFQVPDLTAAPGFAALGLDIDSANVSTTSTCAVQTPLANGVRGSALSAAQLGPVKYPEYYYVTAPPPDRGRYFIHTRFGGGT